MPRFHNINGNRVQFTEDEETDRDAEELFSIEHFHRSIIGQTHNTFLESLPSRPNK